MKRIKNITLKSECITTQNCVHAHLHKVNLYWMYNILFHIHIHFYIQLYSQIILVVNNLRGEKYCTCKGFFKTLNKCCMCVCICACECSCLWRPVEDVAPSEIGVTDCYKLPNVGSGNWSLILLKNSKYS